MITRALASLALLFSALTAAAQPSQPVAPGQSAPKRETHCSANGICYCLETAFKPAIDANLARLRGILAEQRKAGKAVGYQSLPLTTLGGGYFNLNQEVGQKVKQQVEAKLGASQTYLLAPGIQESEIPNVDGRRAGGTEYMVMWTALLEGANGLGEDFDYVYFVGQSDFARALGLTGVGDMDRVNQIYAERLVSDPEFKRLVDQKRITPQSFRLYYTMKGSMNVSLGAHDEWIIFNTINKKRRATAGMGVGNQIPMWFDGRGTSGAESESANSVGYIGACTP